MKIRESIVFEMENQKMKVKTLKRSGCSSNVGHVRVKKTKSAESGLWLSSYYRKVQVQLWQRGKGVYYYNHNW